MASVSTGHRGPTWSDGSFAITPTFTEPLWQLPAGNPTKAPTPLEGAPRAGSVCSPMFAPPPPRWRVLPLSHPLFWGVFKDKKHTPSPSPLFLFCCDPTKALTDAQSILVCKAVNTWMEDGGAAVFCTLQVCNLPRAHPLIVCNAVAHAI